MLPKMFRQHRKHLPLFSPVSGMQNLAQIRWATAANLLLAGWLCSLTGCASDEPPPKPLPRLEGKNTIWERVNPPGERIESPGLPSGNPSFPIETYNEKQ